MGNSLVSRFVLPTCFVLALLVLTNPVSQGGESTTLARRPHIVVFLSDDHGQLDSTPYGATDVQTPHMQRLANAGMTFTHAFVASPACAPSRAAMLTGLMPARNGAEANHAYKRDGVTSLPQVLREMGYETAAFGKVAHGSEIGRHGFDVSDKRHDADFVRRFLESRAKEKPLCLFIGTHEPHVPWPDLGGYDPAAVKLPPTFVDTPETREFRARYYADVTKADKLLGAVYDLAQASLGESTLFVYTSDHGAQWPFGKWNLYDAGIRVPFIAAWPGVIEPGARSGAMIQWIDLLPTLIDAAGGEVPGGLDGRSFLPVLRGSQLDHRDAIFTTHSGDGRMNVYPIRSVRTRDWKLILNLHPDFAHTTHIDKALARDGGRYWISWYRESQRTSAAAAIVKRYHERPAVELYDLANDPYERRNLASDLREADRAVQMQARLEAWMQDQGDSRRVFNEPRLLADPASTRPGENSDSDEPRSGAEVKNGAAKNVRCEPVQRHIEGWIVHAEPSLIDGEHAALGTQALKMLANHLQRIAILVPEPQLKQLQKIEFWMEYSHPQLKAMQYHPSRRWLVDHGHDPRLARKVHITQARELLSRQQMLKHPAMILHELAHGFHDQVLGFDHPDVIEAFNRAKEAGNYDQVLLYTGTTVRHYGLNNHKEYFAEGTEAYFYRNDFYPFVRAELKQHDAPLHDLLQKLWGDEP